MAAACPSHAINSRQLLLQRRPQPSHSARRLLPVCKASQVPYAVLQALKDSNKQWLQQALSSSHILRDDETGCTVHLLGICFFSPLQQRLVAAALDELEPTHILLEQPPDVSADVVLPHPAWLQAMLDHSEDILSASKDWQQTQQQGPNVAAGKSAAAGPGPLQALQEQLAAVSYPEAKVGRDIVDPVETFGYYPGLDLFVNPAASAAVADLCGFLPGQELVVAAEHAMLEGAKLQCIDAPLKLQEQWVKQLLGNFQLDEQQVNSYRPLRDYTDNQQLLPAAAADWDRQLAFTAQQLQQAVATQQQQTNSQDAAHGNNRSAAEQQSLLLYKVSKATAAAMLSPADSQQVIERMQRLQPLKWAHFRLRQRYMAQQIKEACASIARARKAAASRQQQRPGAGPSSTAAIQQPAKLLAVVGRQYVHGLEQMWRNPTSRLWRDRVPRTFMPSVVEKADDYAATGRREAGGAQSSASKAADSSTGSAAGGYGSADAGNPAREQAAASPPI